MGTLEIDQSHGSLLIRTGVAGRAARMGHRLTIRIGVWRGRIELDGLVPGSVELSADFDSLEVVAGEGGVTPLSPIDRGVIKRNAIKSVKAEQHQTVVFEALSATPIADGYQLAGSLTIAGQTHPHEAVLTVTADADGWSVSATTPVKQTDFGIKPYSLMVGSLRVADEVSVEFTARIPKDQLAG